MGITGEFRSWPKIQRYTGQLNITITEKIDGTNSAVAISDDLSSVYAQSRKRLITPEDDNFGFAAWVQENRTELLKLGPGHHFGEWAGPGIQKNPLGVAERKFFLFNTYRWQFEENRPSVCSVVPVLFEGSYYFNNLYEIQDTIRDSMKTLETVRDYSPEGVCVYFHEFNKYLKYTYNNNPKWENIHDQVRSTRENN